MTLDKGGVQILAPANMIPNAAVSPPTIGPDSHVHCFDFGIPDREPRSLEMQSCGGMVRLLCRRADRPERPAQVNGTPDQAGQSGWFSHASDTPRKAVIHWSSKRHTALKTYWTYGRTDAFFATAPTSGRNHHSAPSGKLPEAFLAHPGLRAIGGAIASEDVYGIWTIASDRIIVGSNHQSAG